MRANHFLFIILVCSLFACKKSDIEYDNSFKKSETRWSAFKASNNNSYLFEVISGSSWTGYSSKTSVKVVNGLPVERKFTYTLFNHFSRPQAGWNEQSQIDILAAMNLTAEVFKTTVGEELPEVLEWTEIGSTIGTHTALSSYLTVDEIYSEAKNNWLKKKANVTTYFETKNDGLISNCGYVENGCADDCFVGITISLIQSL